MILQINTYPKAPLNKILWLMQEQTVQIQERNKALIQTHASHLIDDISN